MGFPRIAISMVTIACIAGSAFAEDEWPKHGDVLDRGQELPSHELSDLLTSRTAVIVLLLPGPVIGRVFSCEGDQSVLFEFIPQ